MIGLIRKSVAFLLLLGALVTLSACGFVNGNAKANKPLSQSAQMQLAAMGSSPGAAMMIRIFKQDSILEVWKQTRSGDFKLFRSYDICAWSGDLGPKLKEGDRQSPEGFYTITPALLNPNSSYYLSFNTGFPNKFDRSYGRTGSDLMVHGDCSSRGCYAMTDDGIAEIYALARETFRGGNRSFQLQIYPFRMTPQNLAKHASSPNLAFWKNIKQGYDQFELMHQPPSWDVCNRQYVFSATGPGGAPLDAAAPCPVLTQDPVLVAALAAKEAKDSAAFTQAVAYNEQKQVAAEAAATRVAEQDAAAKARGEAIGGFFSGIFSGFGGSEDQASVPEATTAPVPATKG
jgi:murein L,D-transpeptidase YafK